VLNTEAAMREQAYVTMIFAAEAWLPAACWCDTEMIGVQQREVWWGVTRSCGRPRCVHPETGEQRLGMGVSPAGVVYDVSCLEWDGVGLYTSGRSGGPVGPRNPARVLARRVRRSDGDAPVCAPKRREAAHPPYRAPNRVQTARQGRQPDPEVARRRDLVAGLYELGLGYREIHARLEAQFPGVSVAAIQQDFQLVRGRGVLAGRWTGQPGTPGVH
jgi:hypothetical protein